MESSTQETRTQHAVDDLGYPPLPTQKPLVAQLARSVMNPAMDAVLTKGEGLVGNMSRRSMRGPAGLCLLDLLQLFRSKHNEIKGILEVCSSDVGQRCVLDCRHRSILRSF